MDTRIVSFDGHSVGVQHNNDEVRLLLDFLFSDVADSTQKPKDTEVETLFQIEQSPESESEAEANWLLRRNNETLYKGGNLNELGVILVGEVLFNLIEGNQNGMAVHAGLVSNQAGSWLLPAESGSGKTSVTTWLLTRGWRYHTDELVLIDLDGKTLKAFARPLNVKAPGLKAIGEIFDLAANKEKIRSSGFVTMIPHRLVNPDYSVEIPPLKAIIFPYYSAQGVPRVEQLSGAEAGLELMRSNVIARNLPGHGFAGVAGMVRNLPAWRLHYQHFDELEALLADIMSAD